MVRASENLAPWGQQLCQGHQQYRAGGGYSSPAPDDSFPTGFITGPEGYGRKDIGFGRVAEGINNAGQVVGVTIGGTPFMTGPDGSGERIFDNPGPGEFWGWANEINDAG